MDLHPTIRAFLEQIVDNEIRQIQFVVSAIRNERFWTTTVKNEEDYPLGRVMGQSCQHLHQCLSQCITEWQH
jgi:hypothetical protein